ncbi:MAG: hypothetical protein RQ724_02815, partial [Desulfuromonadales bacterium]|nr:hypothetical protein [Desulfuromonadales bacterium]
AAPAPAAEEDDLWGDMAAAEPIVPEPPVEGAWGEAAVQEEPPADDLWGDVSFDNEAGEDEAIADDWGDFALDSGAEESAPVEPVAVAPAPVTAALDDFGSEAEEEVMALDESDILEIEELDELEDVAVAESTSAAAHDPWGDFSVDETSIETEPLPTVPEGEAEFSFADAAADEPADTTVVADDWGMVVDDEPVSDFGGVADPAAEAVAAEGTEVDVWGNFDLGTAADEEEVYAATPEGEQVFSFDSDETITEPIAPPSAPAKVATTAAEEQIAAIGEEQLEVLIEKVAGRVIEQLAGTILEKIAWEVVPDLAESLIKDEIRKLREAAES